MVTIDKQKRGEPKRQRKTGAVCVYVCLWAHNRSLQDTTDGIHAVRVKSVHAKRSVHCSTRGSHRKGTVTAYRVCMLAQPFSARHRTRHSCDSREERASDRSVYCSTNRTTNYFFTVMSLLSQQNCQAPHQAADGTGGPYRRLRLGSLPVVYLRGEGQQDLGDGPYHSKNCWPTVHHDEDLPQLTTVN